jgi:hypothetical protein
VCACAVLVETAAGSGRQTRRDVTLAAAPLKAWIVIRSWKLPGADSLAPDFAVGRGRKILRFVSVVALVENARGIKL